MARMSMRWQFGALVLVAAIVAVPMIGQQPQAPRDLIKDVNGLQSGYNKGTIAAAPNLNEFYYNEKPESEWIPDEFMSNPDRQIDPRTLPGYHLPPRLLEAELLSPKKVKIGDTVKLRVLTVSKSPVNPNDVIYEGPGGRDTRLTMRWAKAAKTEEKEGMIYSTFEASGRVTQWLPGGTYWPVAIQNLNDELGHGKSYRSDFHPALDREKLSFEVAENPNFDLTAPTLKKFVLGSLDGSAPKLPLTGKMTDLIPVFAEVTDDRSGVSEVKATLMSPKRGLYSDIELTPSLDKENVWVGFFRMNPFYEVGEYKISRIVLTDRARNEFTVFPQENPVVQNRTITLSNDREDIQSPVLVTLDIDKRQAKAGDTVKLTAVVADNLSGVDNVTVTIHSPSAIDKRRVVLRAKPKPSVLIKPAYDVQENIFEGTFTIHPLDETGWWTVKRVIARDIANNYMDVVSTDRPAIEKIQVQFTPSETTQGTFGNTGYTSGAPATRGEAATPGKVRRVDMIPPHPPRGACLNCHEP